LSNWLSHPSVDIYWPSSRGELLTLDGIDNDLGTGSGEGIARDEEGIGDATVEDEEDVNAGTKSGMGVAVG